MELFSNNNEYPITIANVYELDCVYLDIREAQGGKLMIKNKTNTLSYL